MSQMQLLRMFLNERLTAAVVEILEAVEKTVAEYEEENERLRRLLKNTPDIHHSLQFTLAVSEDEVATDPREWCPSPGQENPEPTKIKEEQEELWTSQQEKQLQGLDNDNLEFRFPPRVKSECDQQDEIQSLTLQQTETVENRACDFTTVHHTAFETHLKHLATPCNTLEHQNVFSNTSAVGSDPGFDNRSTLNPNPPMGEHYYQPNTTTSRTHRCSDCGEMFALKDDLQRHVTLAKKRPSECRLDSGTAHIWQAEKHCTCPFCGKTLKYKGDLSRHMRIHTGEKPFSCHDCGKSFNQKGHLSEHIRTHTGEKPFSCGDCGKSFIQKGDLRRHILTHTGEKPFSCVYCGKTFIQKRDLRRHILTHTGEKPFRSGDCGKNFKRKGKLSLHILSHTGENLHKEENQNNRNSLK